MTDNQFAWFFGAIEDGAREREAREYGRDGPHSRWDPGEMPWTIPRRIHPEYRERLSSDPIDWPTVGQSSSVSDEGSNDE
jgi:hypothetical protein